MTTTDIVPQVEKSIKYDRESGDYCCTLTIDGEPISCGYASTYSQGEEWCNAEYYRILQDGVALPPRDEPAVIPEIDEPLPFELTPRSHRAYGPQMNLHHMPTLPVSTLQDGTTAHGQYDLDDSHYTVCADLPSGWSITAGKQVASVEHRAFDIVLDDLTPESWAALKALVNSEAVEHLFTCGAAWDTNQEVLAKQPLTQQQKTRRFVAHQFDKIIADERAQQAA